jgi:quercetin dioxygenase-like cupin family protein
MGQEALMSEVTIKHIEELGYYRGEHAIDGIKFRYAARELGVTAWGMNVIELAPGCSRYPEHDHKGDGQEEVYVILRGAARLRLGSDEQRLAAGALVRVPPHQRRAWLTDDEGAIILAIGATPGQAYAPKK